MALDRRGESIDHRRARARDTIAHTITTLRGINGLFPLDGPFFFILMQHSINSKIRNFVFKNWLPKTEI